MMFSFFSANSVRPKSSLHAILVWPALNLFMLEPATCKNNVAQS